MGTCTTIEYCTYVRTSRLIESFRKYLSIILLQLDPSALVKEEEEDTLDEGGGVDKERKLKEQETLPSKDTTADALNAVGSGDTIDKYVGWLE